MLDKLCAFIQCRRSGRGFTLIEVLVAIAILALVIASATDSLSVQLKGNHDAELKFEGAQAAQTVLDDLRTEDVETMPVSGTDSVRTIAVDSGREFEVYVSYCANEEYCLSNEVRHLTFQVRRDGKVVYTTETVFTAFDTSQGAASSSSSSAVSSSASTSSSSATSSVSTSSSSATSSVSTSSSSSVSTSSSSSSSRSSSSSSSSSRSSRCRSWRC